MQMTSNASVPASTDTRPVPSWPYHLLIVGIAIGALLPVGFFGTSGILLGIWIAVVGGLLLHEFSYPAIVLVMFGLLAAPAYEQTLHKLHRFPPGSSTGFAHWALAAFAITAILIAVIATLVWTLESTPLGLRRVVRGFLEEQFSSDGLQGGLAEYQFSLLHLFGLSTAIGIAAVPVFYLGLSDGTLISPAIAGTIILLTLRRYRLALLSCLAYPLLWQVFFR